MDFKTFNFLKEIAGKTRQLEHRLRRYWRRDPILAMIMIFIIIAPALALTPASKTIGFKQTTDPIISLNLKARTDKADKPENTRKPLNKFEPMRVEPAAPEPPAENVPPAPAPTPAPPQPMPKIVTGWLPGWDQAEGMNSVNANPGVLNEISPFWYYLTPEGGLTGGAGAEDSTVIEAARAQNQKIIPTISNAFDGDRVSPVIDNLERRDQLVNDIVDLVIRNGYEGIDIDFENVTAASREGFTGFVQVLAFGLHERGKLLSVTVMPKTSEPGNPNGGGSAAQDYAAIAQAADQVRIMAYDYHYQGGSPGPVAPVDWVDRLLAFAITVIPKEKIILGVPTYGYDWAPIGGKSNGRAILFGKAMEIAGGTGNSVNMDGPSASPFFQYEAGGVMHYVWFENAESLATKLDLVNKYDIGGITIWRLGREDPANWQVIKEKLGR